MERVGETFNQIMYKVSNTHNRTSLTEFTISDLTMHSALRTNHSIPILHYDLPLETKFSNGNNISLHFNSNLVYHSLLRSTSGPLELRDPMLQPYSGKICSCTNLRRRKAEAYRGNHRVAFRPGAPGLGQTRRRF